MFKQTVLSLLLIVVGCTAPKDNPTPPAKDTSPEQETPSQVDRNYIEGVSHIGLDESLVLVTVTDRNSGLTKTGCVFDNALIGAIHREYGLGYDERSMQIAVAKALAKPLRHLAFGSPNALANVGFRHLDTQDSEACALVRDGWLVLQPDVGPLYTNKPGYRSTHITGPRS